MRNGARIFICAAALAAGVLIFAATNSRKEYNYVDLDSDLDFIILNSGDIIDTIRGGLKINSETIRITFEAEGEYMDDIPGLISELMKRAMEDTGDPKEGDYIFYQYGGYTCEYGHTQTEDGYRYTVIITPEYYMDSEQAAAADEAAEEILACLTLPDDASDYEKIMAVYDYIYENCSYDYIHNKNDNYKLKCTAYGALINKTAVCQGFCVAMYRLLRELDVDCRIVTGMAGEEGDEESHSWIIAGIDGVYYNIDVTWDVQEEEHNYLLLCDDSFALHTRADEFLTEDFLNAYPMAEEDYGR